MIEASKSATLAPLGEQELDDIFDEKYRNADGLGSTPTLYARHDYHSPDDFYEAILARIVDENCRWADVGCGHMLFPSNPRLAQRLSKKCKRLVGIDPDPNIEDNPYLDARVRQLIDDYEPDEVFDLITMRMVAEHVVNPEPVMDTLRGATKPGSLVVIYTVNNFSPIPLLTRVTPMPVRHYFKKLLWRTDPKDTFPTAYKMNSRRDLADLFNASEFDEVYFHYLDDCRTTTRFPVLLTIELVARKAFRKLGMAYPENCLLGVYRRR